MYLWKLINIFYKEYPKKPTITFLYLDIILLITRPSISKKSKQKRDCLNKRANKRGKNEDIELKLLMSRTFSMTSDLNFMLKLLIQNSKDLLFLS